MPWGLVHNGNEQASRWQYEGAVNDATAYSACSHGGDCVIPNLKFGIRETI